jgi:hypothetical protein
LWTRSEMNVWRHGSRSLTTAMGPVGGMETLLLSDGEDGRAELGEVT